MDTVVAPHDVAATSSPRGPWPPWPVAGGRLDGIEQRIWIVVFVASLVAPLVLMPLATDADNFGTKIFSVSAGFVAYMGMALQVLLAARVPSINRSFGMDVLIRLHRYMGVALLALVLVHFGFLLLKTTTMFEWIFFQQRHFKAWTGAVAFWSMILLSVTSIWRRRLRLGYESWRVVHVALTMVAMFGAYAHILVANEYTAVAPIRAVVTIAMLVAVCSFVYLRVGRAFAATGRAYVLERLEDEHGDALTLHLVAAGHRGVAFMPGQFAWLRCAGAPYAIAEHPFTVASSTLDPSRVSFTAKRLGDHTTGYGDLVPGTTVLVDGPHGTWVPPDDARGLVLIAAGIGITPAMGILRTLAAAGRSDVPVQLFYGARRWDDLAFREELDELSRILDLELVITLTQAPDWWTGHRGRVDPALISQHACADAHERAVFMCGPPAMLEPALRTLAQLGVPARMLHAERFEGT